MAKRKPAKKRAAGHATKTAMHEIAHRRREVARLRSCGMDVSLIAKRMGVTLNTITADLRVIEEQWWEATQRDYGKWMQQELGRLETARNEAMTSFYEAANRHGETRQVGYLNAFAKLTDQLHTLLRLNDPQAAHVVGGSDDAVGIVELEIKDREQASCVTHEGHVDVDALKELITRGDG